MREPVAPQDLTAAECADLALACVAMARVSGRRKPAMTQRLTDLAVRMEALAQAGGAFVLTGPARLPEWLDGGATDPAPKSKTWVDFFENGGAR